MERRVVITGLGAVTPIGNDVDTFWENLKAGKCGITKITKFDSTDFKAHVAAEVKDFDPREYLEVNDVLRTDRSVQFAAAAAQQAAEESGIVGTIDPERCAVLFGSGIGGIRTFEAEYSKLQTTYTELAGQLAAAKEELQPMKDIRYWVSKVLTPEQSEVEKKPEPKHSVTEKMKFLQEQSSNQQEQKTPQQKKQNMEL